MVADHLSDFVTRVRNGYRAKLLSIEVPNTRVVKEVAGVLVKTGYLEKAEINKDDKTSLSIGLKYENRKPAITGIRRVSKPGVRIYTGIKDIPKVWGHLGINILSTNKGVVSGKEARKLKAGGEIICQVW
jgi:small subunit ribosomal protein S8